MQIALPCFVDPLFLLLEIVPIFVVSGVAFPDFLRARKIPPPPAAVKGAMARMCVRQTKAAKISRQGKDKKKTATFHKETSLKMPNQKNSRSSARPTRKKMKEDVFATLVGTGRCRFVS